MNEDDPRDYKVLTKFGEQLREAGHTARKRRRFSRLSGRSLLAALAGLLIVGGAGVAVAEIAGDDSKVATFDPATQTYEPNYPQAGATVGYIDLKTGDPIRCADGRLLIFEPPPGNVVTPGYPRGAFCEDGSRPEVFQQQMEEFKEFANTGPAGTPVVDGPNFSVALERLEEAGVPFRVPTTVSGENPDSTEERADAYAQRQSGATEPCSSTATGNRPGCIYSAAYGGCYEGIEGEPVGNGIEEFPQPKLAQTYRTARRACS